MKNNAGILIICAMCIALASCGTNMNDTGVSSGNDAVSDNGTVVTTADGGNTASAVTAAVTVDSGTVSTAAASDMFTNRDYEIGYSDAVTVSFADGGSSVSDTSTEVEDNTVRITKAGTYRITGTISDGQIIVDAPDDAKIQIVLDNASVTCKGGAALYIKNADKVFVTTAEGSVNTLSSVGEFTADGDTNVDGAVFAKSDITFNGAGTLNISSDSKHGIVCKDDLKFTSGTYNVTSASKGIDCNESVRVAGGTITVTSGTDGIHAENTEEPEKAFVYICGGNITITSENDAIDASGEVTVTDGSINITANGGASNAPAHSGDFGGGFRWDWDNRSSDSETTAESCKGIKSGTLITVSGGTINIDSSDDAVHSSGPAVIGGGTLTVKTGDDGIHADSTVLVSDGNVTVSGSYEGIEGQVIEISGGKVNVKATDDGMNASGGTTKGTMNTEQDAKLIISGGTVYVNADGDGLDSNGYLYVTGGYTFVSGPTNSGNGALDSGIEATVTGGYIIATGSTGMAENFGSNSTQGSILYTFDSTVSGGTEISLTDGDGNVLVSYTPEKDFRCAVISAPEIEQGSTYTVTAGSSEYSVEMTSLIYGSGSGFGFGFGGGMGGFGGGRRGNGQNSDTADSDKSGDSTQAAPSGEMPDMSGEMPQMPDNGEMPEMPDNGEMPQMPNNGEMPEMPQFPNNGEMPQMPNNGEMPQMPEGGFGGFGGGRPQQNDAALNSDTSPI